jgi:phospholipid-binding lipoprotein MlaA
MSSLHVRLPSALFLLLLALGGCASQTPRRAGADAPDAVATTAVDEAAVAETEADTAIDSAAAGAAAAAAAAQAAPTAAATDADAALPAPQQAAPSPDSLDPWQPFNRRMHKVNSVLDRILLRPVAKVYARVTPNPVRKGVSNFFDNLQQPVTTLNLGLQGKPKQAAQSAGRFLLNITLGLVGIFDPATQMGLPLYHKDFGQTFAAWGWQTSRYLVLPVFGPGTVRDAVGKGVATTVSPVSWLAEQEGAEFSVLYGIDARAAVLPLEAFMADAPDEYLLIRDAFLQRRRCQIVDCSEDVPDYLLPDYEFEVPDLESMRR